MKKTIKALLLGIVLVATMTLSSVGGVEASLSEQKKEAEDNIAAFKKEIQKLEGQIFEVLAKIDAVETSIAYSEAKINQLEKELVIKEAELEEATEKFNVQKEGFYQNVRSKYEDGEIEYVSVILDSSNLTEIINYNEYYRIMKEREEGKIKEIKEAKAVIESQKAAIEENKKITIEQMNSMAVEKDKLAAVKKTYDASKANLQKQLAAEEADRADIIKQINSLIGSGGGGIYTGNGVFQWPVPSIPPTTTNIQRFSSSHKGFDIGGYGVAGRTIVAAETGTVIMAKSYYGYGNCVIINHGSGIVTLYGHLARIDVSAGQAVSRGKVIGIMGDTGQSSGIHLHFEVIINGVNVNPEPYIR